MQHDPITRPFPRNIDWVSCSRRSSLTKKGNHPGKSFRIENSAEGFECLKKLAEISPDISWFVFGMEATGHYQLNLCTRLCDRNFTVHVINQVQFDAMRRLQIRQTKINSIDAFLIADCIRPGKYCRTNSSDDDMIALRDLTRQRFYMVDMTSDIKRKVIAIMDRIFSEYESLFSDMLGTTLATIILSEIGDIRRFPDPKQLTAFAGHDPVLKQSGSSSGFGYHI